MTRRTPTNRRAVLHGACAATLTLLAAPAAGAAKAAECDGELIALLDEARALLRAPEPPRTAPITMAEVLARPPHQAVLQAAARLPARTPEGLRAKAEMVADWLAGQDRRTGPGFDCEGEPAVAWSLCRDLLGEEALAPVPALRPDVTEEQVKAMRAQMPPPVVLPEVPDVPWLWTNAERAVRNLPPQDDYALALTALHAARTAEAAGDMVRAHNLLQVVSVVVTLRTRDEALGVEVAWNTDLPRRPVQGGEAAA